MRYKNMDLSKTWIAAVSALALLFFLSGCAATSPSLEAEAAPASGAAKLITAVAEDQDSDYYYVDISANNPLTYTSVKETAPLGIIFYFPETSFDSAQTNAVAANEVIASVKTSEMDDKGSAARVEILLKKDVNYSIEKLENGRGIRIALPKPQEVQAKANLAETQQPEEVQKEEEKPEEKPPVDLSSLPAATKMESIYTVQSENGLTIKVMANGVIRDFRSFTITDPARIVFDIFNLKENSPKKKEQLIPVHTKWARSIRYFVHPNKLRVVVDTAAPYLKSFAAAPTENGLLIQVGSTAIANPAVAEGSKAAESESTSAGAQQDHAQPSETTPIAVDLHPEGASAAAANAEAAGQEGPARTAGAAGPGPTAENDKMKQPAHAPVAAAKPAVRTGPAWVDRIDFSSEKEGKSTLIIGTTQPVQYDIKKEAEKRIQLRLLDTRLPEYRQRPLITTRFQSAVDRILPFEAPALKDTSLFAIELREAVPFSVEQKGNLLLVHFEASEIPPQSLAEAKLPPWQAVMANTALAAAEGEKKTTVATEEQAPEVEAKEPVLGTAKTYTGEKIALDFYDTDIKNVFRILREVSRKNFAIDKGVAGKVTLTLEEPVPWDQVLDLILKMNGLGMTYEGDIIRIAKMETIEKEARALREKLAAERKARLEEQQAQKELEPLETEYISVNYANASTEILPKVKPVVTKGRGEISVDGRNNQLIVTDTPSKIEQIREIVKKIDQVTPQVLIEARIVEATNTFTRSIGTQWGIQSTVNHFGGASLGGDLTYDMSATNPPLNSFGTFGINFSRLVGTPFEIIDARISASESEGDLNIISAPKILTLNNKKATIKQGVQYPYNKLVDGEVRTEFINVDLLLEVEPLVTPDHRIAMKLKVTNNELGAIVNQQQSFTTKEAETELLVNDGETVVIGGIRKATKRNDISGIPVMKDIPVLGWLFKSKEITDNKEELLIFITPQIVQLEQRS